MEYEFVVVVAVVFVMAGGIGLAEMMRVFAPGDFELQVYFEQNGS